MTPKTLRRNYAYLILLSALSAYACQDSVVSPAVRAAVVPDGSTIETHLWTPVDAAPGTLVVIRAKVRDAEGVGMAGVSVRWLVKLGGGTVQSVSSTTNANGVAVQQWTLGPPGLQRVNAVVSGLSAAHFEANSVADGAHVDVVGGDDQIRAPGGRFDRFVARALDGDGNPIAGAAVSWSIATGNGTLQGISTSTDANGNASARLNAAPEVQQLAVVARVSGAGSATFSARVSDGSEIVLDTVVATGLVKPLLVTAPAGDDRLFIVEQIGRIRVFENGALLETPFLDLRAVVGVGGEKGLLGIVFHPQYASNGYFFVNYTDLEGTTRIERYHATPGSNVADAGSAKLILTQTQPVGSHNGGHLLFGPDGKLFIPLGDGGGGNDPERNGQNLGTLLAKVLRINVDVAESRPYVVPNSNPFIDNPDARPEIWALGLRNPWRFAFDRGLMYLSDVGESKREEVNVVPASQGGLNFGWRIMEGTVCRGTAPCDSTGFTAPVLDYDHTEGCSIIGGFVYRGAALPEIDGLYFYSDFCSGWVRSFRYQNGAVIEKKQWDQLGVLTQPTSFGLDGQGELYITTREGVVAKFVRQP